jgi:hypothetical protein
VINKWAIIDSARSSLFSLQTVENNRSKSWYRNNDTEKSTNLQLVPDHMSKRNVAIRKWNSIPLMHHVLEASP